MKYHATILLCFIAYFAALPCIAAEWLVKPRICVTSQQGEACHMDVEIEYGLKGNDDQKYCLFLAQVELQCNKAVNLPKKLSLVLRENSVLILQEGNGKVLLSEQLKVRTSQLSLRRRVRSPWSLFK